MAHFVTLVSMPGSCGGQSVGCPNAMCEARQMDPSSDASLASHQIEGLSYQIEV